MVCHAFDASHAHAAMVEDTLTCFHDIYHATLKDKPAASTCYEVHSCIGEKNRKTPALPPPLTPL